MNTASEPPIKDPELLFVPFAQVGESIGLPLFYSMLKDVGGLLSDGPDKEKGRHLVNGYGDINGVLERWM